MYQDTDLDAMDPRELVEVQYIGSIFNSNKLLENDKYVNEEMNEAVALFSSYQFQNRAAALMFELLKGHWGTGVALDGFLVQIHRTEELKPVEIAIAIQATAATLSPVQVRMKLLDYHKLDQMKNEVISLAKKLNTNSFDVSSNLAKMIEIIQPKDKHLFGYSEVVDKTLEAVERACSGEVEPRIKFGWPKLDEITNGFGQGELVIVAARPSVGKTAFALNMVNRAYKQNHRMIFFSLEMPMLSIGQRLLAMGSGVNSKKLFSGTASDAELDRIANYARKAFCQDRFYVADNSKTDINIIRAQTAQAAAKMGGIDIVFVDYIGLIKTSGKQQNREREIAELSMSLKQLAREHNAVVVALSQLNRKMADRKDNQPLMSDLRDSGSLEQDADQVMLIHRPHQHSTNPDDDQNKTEVLVVKNRNGEVGGVNFNFERHIMHFNEQGRIGE
jgi:replicative DNA helicase